jgi:cysteine-rich repeat protein
VLLEYETCDDNNTVEGDGCSAKCQSEKDFDCGVAQPSACVLNVNIGSIVFSHVSRELGKNQAIMSFKIFPIHDGLAKLKWERLVKFNFSSTAVDSAHLTFNYQPLTGELTVTVPYSEELEESHLESFFALDPAYIVSQPSSFLLTHQLKGANAPLIFEELAELATQKNINLITLLLTILLLLQFYAGSYSHKMIGLETIQVIQSVYFVRMAAASSSSSLMNSINSIQYSAGGYHNS